MPCRFLPSEGKLGEDVRAPRGPERVSTKLVRQAGRQAGPQEVGGHGGAHVQGTALSSASGLPGPCGLPAGARGFQGGKVPVVLSAHCLFPGKQLMPGLRAGGGGVGVWAKATGEACGKQGEEAATASRAARGLLGRPLARTRLSSEAAWAPSHRSCAWSDLSPLGHSRSGAAQKMLCRRFFPRPGKRKERCGAARSRRGPSSPEISRGGLLCQSQQEYALGSWSVLRSNPIPSAHQLCETATQPPRASVSLPEKWGALANGINFKENFRIK